MSATSTPLVEFLAEQSDERLAGLRSRTERQLAKARERVASLEFQAEQIDAALARAVCPPVVKPPVGTNER